MKQSRRKIAAEVIQQRMSSVMLNEALLCLQEKILDSGHRRRPRGAVSRPRLPALPQCGPFRYIDLRWRGWLILHSSKPSNRNTVRALPRPQILAEYAKGRPQIP